MSNFKDLINFLVGFVPLLTLVIIGWRMVNKKEKILKNMIEEAEKKLKEKKRNKP